MFVIILVNIVNVVNVSSVLILITLFSVLTCSVHILFSMISKLLFCA